MGDINCQWQEYRSRPSEAVSFAESPNASSRLPHANPQNGRDSRVRPNIATLSSHQRNSDYTAPLLTSPASLKYLKRPFCFEQPSGASDRDGHNMVELATVKPTMQPDHQLLSFFRSPDQHTIFDLIGHVQSFDISLHLQGMFFLVEASIPASGENPPCQQQELTCYRRNLFSVAGSVSIPPGVLSVVTDRGERVSIVSQELSLSATESLDGNTVRLIVIPWRTPPPNMPQLPAKQDQEPPSVPLIPFEDSDSTPGSENTLCHIAWRRLQFRIATANNGRRKELQQHFVLHAKVIAGLSNGMRINVCEANTAPIVVRGRSPRNFQRKEENPLGSEAGAGKAMNLTSPSAILAESPQASLSRDLSDLKSRNQAAAVLPLSPFQFDPSHLPRFSPWPSLPQQYGLTAEEKKPSNRFPRGSLNIVHSIPSVPEIQHNHSAAGETYHFLPSPTVMPSSLGSYSDDNSRSAKTPRHVHSPGGVHSIPSSPEIRHNHSAAGDICHFLQSPPVMPSSLGSYSDDNPRLTKMPRHVQSPGGDSQIYRPHREYQEISFHNTAIDRTESYHRDYHVSPSHPEPWVATGQANAVSTTPHQQLQYPPSIYPKHEPNHPIPYPWSNT